jgi:hypothetical protein
LRWNGSLERAFLPSDLPHDQTPGIHLPSANFRLFRPRLIKLTSIEIELLRKNGIPRGTVISAMDKIGQIRAGQNVDSTAVLATHGKQLSECRSRKPHRTV